MGYFVFPSKDFTSFGFLLREKYSKKAQKG